MNLIIFEDHQADGFYPISISHPVFDLFYGCFNVVDRLKLYFKPDNIFLYCRGYLADIAGSRYGLPVNDFKYLKGDSILVNAALIPEFEVLDRLVKTKAGTIYYGSNGLIGGVLSAEAIQNIELNKIAQAPKSLPSEIEIKEIDATLFRHLWEIINLNDEAIEGDVKLLLNNKESKKWRKSTRFGDNVFIHQSANVQDGAYIDDSSGAVVIDEGAKVEPRSLIQGPAYIGKYSVVMAGMIREGCSLGPVCKVGGELEESIVLGYTNKCHEGFIGHAYLGEWVNLGAMTTNSDLKNNYGEISVSLQGQIVKTGSVKVGCFVGDHTKTGIGTLLNTGIVIGFSNNLYGGSLFMDKEIAHFQWGMPGQLETYRLDKAMEVAQSAMSRRGVKFDDIHKRLFTRIAGYDTPS